MRPPGDVAQDVVGENRVKGRVCKGQRPRDVAYFEAHLVFHPCADGQLVRSMNSQIIDIHTKDVTAKFLRDMQGVGAGSAADFQHRRIAGECKRSWNLFGLLGSDPARLAEIFSVSLDSYLSIDI